LINVSALSEARESGNANRDFISSYVFAAGLMVRFPPATAKIIPQKVNKQKCRKGRLPKDEDFLAAGLTFSNDAIGEMLNPYGDRRVSYFKSQIRKMNIMRIVRQETRLK
jgi:hypothetical protein